MYNGVYTIEQYAYMHDTLMKWLNCKVNNENLGEKLCALGVEKVAVYGANGLGELVGKDIQHSSVEIVNYIDKNSALYGQKRCDVQIIAPSEVLSLPQDCFVLVVPEYYYREILDNLLREGLSMERIISLSMIV